MRKLTMTENMTPIDKKLIEKGMTRSDLSKQSGVPLRTIESWCRRLRVPRDVYQLLKLAKVLGCQIEDLISSLRAKVVDLKKEIFCSGQKEANRIAGACIQFDCCA